MLKYNLFISENSIFCNAKHLWNWSHGTAKQQCRYVVDDRKTKTVQAQWFFFTFTQVLTLFKSLNISRGIEKCTCPRQTVSTIYSSMNFSIFYNDMIYPPTHPRWKTSPARHRSTNTVGPSENLCYTVYLFLVVEPAFTIVSVWA